MNIPYTETHIGTISIIIDITYHDETTLRGVIAHSLEYEPMENGYNLKVYESLDDVFRRRAKLFADVKKIEVVGVRL